VENRARSSVQSAQQAQPVWIATRLRRKLAAMKRFVLTIVLAVCITEMGKSQPTGKRPQLIVIHRPTIEAFSLPITEGEAKSGEGDAEALDDFNYYAHKVEGSLKKAGIEFPQISGRSFQIRDGTKTRLFQTGKIGTGCYFISPSKEPHVEYGVMTDEDLVDAAQKYFGVPIPIADSIGAHRSK
jgi:hypothetical protein